MSENKFEPQGTKISPAMAEVWNAICEALGTDTYHMLQHFIYAMIRAASDMHELTPDIKRLMAFLDSDVGWQNAINLCAPNGKLSIAQIVLIVEQEGKQGFAAVMLDKPFCGKCRQTECVDDIFERVTEVCMKGIYKKLSRLAADMGCNSQSDLLLTMIDAQTIHNLEESNSYEMKGEADYSEFGRKIEYGKKNKRKRHRTPDSLANSQPTIHFDDIDKNLANHEVNNWESDSGDLENEMGFRPFGNEW